MQQLSPAQIQAMNAQARAAVVNTATPITQKIATLTQANAAFTSGVSTVLNVSLQPVGLLRSITLDCLFSVAQGAAETLTAQTMGGSAALSNVTLTDLNQLQRVNTHGVHLANLASARRGSIYGAAVTTSTTWGAGSNYTMNTTPTTVTTAQNVRVIYEIPVAYGDNDTRGAMFLQSASAVANLQLTINPLFIAPNNGDATLSVYKSSSSSAGSLGAIATYSIAVYQNYWDQLPRNTDGSFFLPTVDMGMLYQLLQSSQTGMAVAADFSVPFAPFRTYMSKFAFYDNAGTANTGSDINYFSLTAANAYQYWNLPPRMIQLMWGRNVIMDDWQAGMYYFPFRARPISTTAQGVTQLNLNASSVTSSASILYLWDEFFAFPQQLQNAPAIANA